MRLVMTGVMVLNDAVVMMALGMCKLLALIRRGHTANGVPIRLGVLDGAEGL